MANKKSTRKRSKGRSSVLSPLDVRSPAMLKEMEKRIRKGPVTLVLIYADWCGHCHHLMPHWDQAAQSSRRSAQAVKVNEKMLSDVNSMVNRSINQRASPINVDAYPTIILVDNQGNPVTNVEAVRDTAALTKVMDQAGSLANQAGPESIAPPSPLPSPVPVEQASFPSIQRNAAPRPLMEQESVEEPRLPLKTSSISQEDSVRPSVSLYSENPSIKERDPLKRSMKGGSLYAALSQTAYRMAPAATLLGMAAYVMRKGNKSRKSRKAQKARKSAKAAKRR
jgi:thiol-disulfide isomerase/thioredoxin